MKNNEKKYNVLHQNLQLLYREKKILKRLSSSENFIKIFINAFNLNCIQNQIYLLIFILDVNN